VVAIIWFGMGFLSLAPVLSLAALAALAWRLVEVPDMAGKSKRFLVGGFLLGGVAIAAVDGPRYVARLAMNMAVSEDEGTRTRGIAMLRAAGSEETVLRACYEPRRSNAGGTDNAGWVMGKFGRTSAGEARELYYRMTGRAFNSVPQPRMHSRFAEETLGGATRGVWDEDQGGAEVGGRVSGLSLASSRIDTHVDAASALAYTEWALVFSNRSTALAEARFDVALPPGGAVSRLTLWINGEPHEAAFGTKSQTRGAYESVVRRQRDPVLITQSAPGRVLVQCYPVPVGGQMKIRFGVTAPLDAKSRAWLPTMLDRNFAVRRNLKHSLWAQCADSELAAGFVELGEATPKGGGHGLEGSISSEQLTSGDAWLAVGNANPMRTVHAIDQLGDPNAPQLVVRRGTMTAEFAPEQLVVVVDTSAGMRPFWSEIENSIGWLAERTDVTLVLAADEIVVVEDEQSFTRTLDRTRATGGVDNSPALLRAIEKASRTEAASVLWFHGAQPFLLSDAGEIEQTLERRVTSRPITSLQLGPGADKVSEFFAGLVDLRPAPRGASLAEQLELLFAAERIAHQYKRLPADAPAPEGSTAVWDQLVRHWALEDVSSELAASDRGKGRAELATRAARYQLVTPLTGAVVLENQAQFDAAGLDQLAASETPAIPTIPEPSTGVLALLGGLLFAMRRRRPC
jgi:hypothetical protein